MATPSFEHRSGFEDLDGLVVRDSCAHAGSSMGLAHDEPFLLEPDERRSHRAARHVDSDEMSDSIKRVFGAISPRTIASRRAL